MQHIPNKGWFAHRHPHRFATGNCCGPICLVLVWIFTVLLLALDLNSANNGNAASLEAVAAAKMINPQRIGTYQTSGNVYAVAVSNNYAYIAEFGVQVIDVRDP